MESRERCIYFKPDEELHEEIIADLIRDKNEIEFKRKKLDFERKYLINLSILTAILFGIMITLLILNLEQQKLIYSLSCMLFIFFY
jgi:hypothetical protein